MKLLSVLPIVLLLAACDEPVSVETIDSLAVNPERLNELRERCEIEALEDELCNKVKEATRKAFMGDGEVPYTPPTEKPVF